MEPEEEETYLEGQRSAWREMRAACDRHLGVSGDGHKQLLEARAALWTLCRDLGVPNGWPDELHLADVVEKWIRPHLRQKIGKGP